MEEEKEEKNEKEVQEEVRAFVSVDIPEELYPEIKKIQNMLPGFRGKLIAPENLHLTLKFLGEIKKETLEKVKEKLGEVEFKPVDARISKIGVFSSKYVRIVWLKIENMDALQKRIDEKISELEEFEMENRFMGHITIARVKSLKNKNYFLGELNKIEIPKKLKFNVDKFRLKKSTLYPEGPVYEVLEDFSLSDKE